ncbi:flagellin lysine-N-methylase [Clostridium perfringens]|uniref:Lysine-N-methylase n=1 Tax=Clostridium perfringens TaxID=1502 RepID=A0AAW9IF60_CLOPF|nr:flagellin lysine-N-methylase [Clostridium perfringens]EIF6167373.1 flagellin lysine-N-methylase [Clostridium perfringens]EJT6498783.1 flagellin lysine-N-methylase [Clostridium perfringens]ELC8360737.1 flagellin lysine-N-methylase [Clostridium perfringens]MBO3321169.1 flagellin lysine-N-methylase [Clostridium perfringens]MBO3330458.1 flagellin lysine-N-methylase [Clostridium perfringens]
MNKEINMLKISGYNDFKCTANKCKFTCCEGWDINIDKDTYERWEKDEKDSNYLLNGVKTKECNGKEEYFINKETFEKCPFLDCEGLCNIVKSHGEGYLSKTCHSFPRMNNDFGHKRELSLSCACPEVVEILDKIHEKIGMEPKSSNDEEEDLLELKIRESLINIIYEDKFSLDERLLIGFDMLLNILEDESYTSEEILLEELEKYSDNEYRKEVAYVYNEIELNRVDSLLEINSLFLDMVENYREVSNLKCILEEISNFAEEANIESLSEDWKEYKENFKEFHKLLEKCIVSKIYSNCISDDMEDMILSFQLIILEYLLVRYAVFLNYCINDEKIQNEEVKDYIVIFSRIIGNNAEAVLEFLSDGFEDPILEMGYLCFITLF